MARIHQKKDRAYMKRVLIVADRDLGNSGVPAVIMSIVRGLHSKYIFDIIVFENTETAFTKEFLSYGGKIVHLDIKKPSSILNKIFFYLSNYRKQIFDELAKKIKINDYSIVHSFKGIFSAPFLEYAEKNGIKKRILHINGIYDKNPKLYLELLNKRNKQKCIKYSNVRLAVSNEAGHSFFGRCNYKCIYNPINDKLYKKLPPYFDKLSLTQIGTYSDRKNQLFTLEVFKKVKEKYPSSILNFLGYEVEPGYLERIKALAKEYGIQDSIIFYDPSYSQIELLKKTSICLFPSKSEAFGLVAVENQACNRPVLCSNKIMKDIDCGGAIFLDFEPEEWANTIDHIYFNRKTYNINLSRFNSDDYCHIISSVYS